MTITAGRTLELRTIGVVGLFAILTAGGGLAQETRDGIGEQWAWPRSLDPSIELTGFPRPNAQLVDNGLPNVLLTGYWPPTNEMLRPWSTDPNQNPGGWVGENWRGLGYNVYAFFPEFPGGTGSNPKGDGDFEVDYQDTSADWWHLLPIVRPIAITTTSRANTARGWEMEGGNGFYSNSAWSNDYLSPFDPTANEPSDPPGSQRFSSLPMQAIVDAVAASTANVDPFIAAFDSGRFLSNYIGYHGNWWKDLHDDPSLPDRCYAAGHIHVGSGAAVPDSTQAMEITLEVLLAEVDLRRADFDDDGDYDLDDISAALLCVEGPGNPLAPACAPADVDQDVDADMRDIAWRQARYGAL